MARAIAGIVAFIGLAAVSNTVAQEPARIDPNALQQAQERLQQVDPDRLEIQEFRLQPAQTDAQQFPDPAGYQSRADTGPWLGWVNFNRSGEPAVSAGASITRAYEDVAGGVRFSFGERPAPQMIVCREGGRECGGGAPSGGHVLRDEDGVLRIDFARSVFAVTLFISPDWTRDIRADVFQIEGWGDGDILLQARANAPAQYTLGENWVRLTLNGQQRQTATVTAAPTGAAPAIEFDYVVIRAFNANGGTVNAPILIDDLRFADTYGETPLDNLGPRTGGLDPMLEDTGRLGPSLEREAETIREGGARENALYPVARRIRMAIDYEAAQRGAEGQRARIDADISIPTRLGRAENVSAPILAPLGAFAEENPRGELAEDVAFMGRPDFYHLILPTELGEAVITGTRLASPTETGRNRIGTIAVGRGYGGARASFNLYGASYSVRLSCDGSDLDDQPCNDPAALETLLERLFLFMPPEEDRR